MPQIKARTLEEFINIVMAVENPDQTIFRGQAKDWDLEPKLARKKFDIGDVLQKEQFAFNEFKRTAPLLLSQMQVQDSQDWEWLALAQHHGMATRLLDWSKNPLIALYFAVENPYLAEKGEPSSRKFGVVWILEYEEKHLISSESEQAPFSVPSTRVFYPRCVTNRIINQSGCFTVHHFLQSQSAFIPLPNESEYKNKLKKIIIPANAFATIRDQLNFIGIHSASVYPDIDGLTKHLTRKISLSSDSAPSFVNSIKQSLRKQSPLVKLIR